MSPFVGERNPETTNLIVGSYVQEKDTFF